MSLHKSNRRVCRASPPRWIHVLCSAGCLLAAFLPARLRAGVVINEVMASNVGSFSDPQGDFDDWIELYNTGDTPVFLGGMCLTDDLDAPTKWQIPLQLSLIHI